MSDWGAVNDRVEALKAGMDLEMPSSNGVNDALIVKAVQDGTLDEAVVDQACERILNIIYRYMELAGIRAQYLTVRKTTGQRLRSRKSVSFF